MAGERRGGQGARNTRAHAERAAQNREAVQQQDDPPDGGAVQEGGADREREVMGGHGADTGAQGFSFEYGGQRFESPEALTRYLDDNKPTERASQTRTQPAAAPLPAPAPAPAPAADKDWFDQTDWSVELFRDPTAAVKKLREGVTQEVRQQLTTAYQADTALTKYWTDFYTENKDMVGKESLVTTVMQEVMPEVGNLPLKESRAKIAAAVRGRLQEWGVAPNREARTGDRTEVEGGGTGRRTAPRSQQGEDTPPRSLSALIRQRQNTKRGANGASPAGQRSQVE